MPCPTSWDPFFKAMALASVRATSTTGTPVAKLHNSAFSVDLENHTIAKDIGNTARDIHDAPVGDQAATRPLLPKRSHTPVTAPSSRVILPDRSPHTRGDHGMARRAGAKPR
jgi:hypothetical protein